MARILALSSLVCAGRVGLRVIVPALEQMGHEVITLPSMLLSSHAAHRTVSRLAIDPDELVAMVEAIDANGWMREVAAVLTGYLPTEAHAAAAAQLVKRVKARSPPAMFVCDPILGDTPKGLYIDPGAAAAIRDILVPMADAITPNAFELGWLTCSHTGALPGTSFAHIEDAADAAQSLLPPLVFATSLPAGDDHLATVLFDRGTQTVAMQPRREAVPHGTGDLFAALLTGHLANGAQPAAALHQAAARLAVVIEASLGRDDLNFHVS